MPVVNLPEDGDGAQPVEAPKAPGMGEPVNFGRLAMHVASAIGTLKGSDLGDNASTVGLQYVLDELMKLACESPTTEAPKDTNSHVSIVKDCRCIQTADTARDYLVYVTNEGEEVRLPTPDVAVGHVVPKGARFIGGSYFDGLMPTTSSME